jgi:hypothetical protein
LRGRLEKSDVVAAAAAAAACCCCCCMLLLLLQLLLLLLHAAAAAAAAPAPSSSPSPTHLPDTLPFVFDYFFEAMASWDGVFVELDVEMLDAQTTVLRPPDLWRMLQGDTFGVKRASVEALDSQETLDFETDTQTLGVETAFIEVPDSQEMLDVETNTQTPGVENASVEVPDSPGEETADVETPAAQEKIDMVEKTFWNTHISIEAMEKYLIATYNAEIELSKAGIQWDKVERKFVQVWD